MAPAAIDGNGRASRLLYALVARNPERAEFTLRLSLICTLTLLVVELYGTPDPALTVYVAFFLNKPDRTTSLIMNVAFVLIVSIVIGLVFAIAGQVVNDPAIRLAVMSGFSFGIMFLASSSKLKPLASIVALVVTYALALLGTVPVGELATRGLLYAWLFVGIPAGVSIIVNLLFAPAPRRLAERGLARRLRAAAKCLDNPGGRSTSIMADMLAQGIGPVLGNLHLAGVEHTARPADLAALGEAAHRTGRLMFLVEALARRGDLPEDWRWGVAATLGEMAAAFESGGYPTNITLPNIARRSSADTMALMADVTETLARFTGPAPVIPAHAKKPDSGFFVPDAFTNPVHVQYALKVTAAAMSCYLLYSLLDWNGIHTALITCYIVSLGTAAETVEKLSLRIVGCLAGAAVGLVTLVYVLPSLDSIAQLLPLVFLAILPAAWVAAGSPRISYAGFQFAFAFLLCVVQGSAPAFDLAVARDRVIGILVGNVVSYLFLTALWPVSIGRRIDPSLATLLRKLGGLARSSEGERRVLVPAFEGALAAMRADIQLLRYEPARLRADRAWIAGRRDAVEEIGALEGPIILAGVGGAQPLDSAAGRLDDLAHRLDGGAPSPDVRDTQMKTPTARPDLAARLKLHLDTLDERLAASHG